MPASTQDTQPRSAIIRCTCGWCEVPNAGVQISHPLSPGEDSSTGCRATFDPDASVLTMTTVSDVEKSATFPGLLPATGDRAGGRTQLSVDDEECTVIAARLSTVPVEPWFKTFGLNDEV